MNTTATTIHNPTTCHYCTRWLCHDCIEQWSDCKCDAGAVQS